MPLTGLGIISLIKEGVGIEAVPGNQLLKVWKTKLKSIHGLYDSATAGVKIKVCGDRFKWWVGIKQREGATNFDVRFFFELKGKEVVRDKYTGVRPDQLTPLLDAYIMKRDAEIVATS